MSYLLWPLIFKNNHNNFALHPLKSLHFLLYFFLLSGHETNESKELETVARVRNQT